MAEAVKVRSEEAPSGPSLLAKFPEPVQKFTEYPRRLRQFLHEVRQEMNRVTWPTWPDVKATTTVVIFTVFFFAAFLFLVDVGVSHLVDMVLKRFRP